MEIKQANIDTQNIVLAPRPPLTSTIPVLPLPLLDSLLPNLSTLSSVYHKLPSAFLGHGRAGAVALQQAAIDEAAQNALENPIAAAAAAAAVAGHSSSSALTSGGNAENLLDIDFDGAAPASLQKAPTSGASGLEGLAGTPQRVLSPVAGSAPASGGMDDLMGMFGNGNASASGGMNGGFGGGKGSAGDDLMDGFAGMDLNTNSGQPPPASQQLGMTKKTNEDLLGMFD